MIRINCPKKTVHDSSYIATCNQFFCVQDCRSRIVKVEYQGQTRNTRTLERKPLIDTSYRIRHTDGRRAACAGHPDMPMYQSAARPSLVGPSSPGHIPRGTYGARPSPQTAPKAVAPGQASESPRRAAFGSVGGPTAGALSERRSQPFGLQIRRPARPAAGNGAGDPPPPPPPPAGPG